VDFPPAQHRPCFALYRETFRTRTSSKPHKTGVYYHWVKEEPDEDGVPVEKLYDTWILSVLDVLAIVRTTAGDEHSYLIEYVEHGTTQLKRAVLDQGLMLGRLEELLKRLRSIGISALYRHRELIRQYLDEQHLRFSPSRPEDFWHSTKQTGWYNPTGAAFAGSFVLPHEIIGAQTGVWYSSRGELAQYEKAGEYEKWQALLAAPCANNPYLLMALGCAFTGPLLEPLNLPIVGLHFFGDSSYGKTSSLAPAISVWGPPKFMLSWRMTVNGLESQAACRSGTLYVIDESHLAEPKHLDSAIYMLANGTSKARMNRDASAKARAFWKTVVLSCGERSLETHLTNAGVDYKAGQAVRIVDQPIQPAYGIFDCIHGCPSGGVFADKLRSDAAVHYGHARPKFVEWLIERLPSLGLKERLPAMTTRLAACLPAREERVARSFALIAVAGDLAIEARILPLEVGSFFSAAKKLFDIWLAAQPHASSREHAKITEAVLGHFHRHGDTRYTDIKPKTYETRDAKGNPVTECCEQQPEARDRAGYWDDATKVRTYLVFPHALREATTQFDFDRVLRALEEAAAFVKTDGKRRSIQRRVPVTHTLTRFYWIDPSKLEASDS
jgi:putative DNA primase/helicase